MTGTYMTSLSSEWLCINNYNHIGGVSKALLFTEPWLDEGSSMEYSGSVRGIPASVCAGLLVLQD